MLKSWFQKVILTPPLWFGVAAIAIAGSFVLDYVDAQRTADRALALRQGPPPVVAIQDFVPAAHTGHVREVLIWAEASLGDPVVVPVGPKGAERSAMIFPLFPLSAPGVEAVRRGIQSDGTIGTVRPVPRPDPTAVVDMPQALGVMLHLTDPGTAQEVDPDTLIARSFGRGLYGTVVEVNGERIAPGELGLVVKGAMAAIGYTIPDDVLTIAPFVDGRLSALAPPPSSGLQRALLWGGILIALAAALLSIRIGQADEPRTAAPKRPGQQDTRASTGRTVKARTRFQTIPTQDELYASSRAEEARASENTATKKLIEGAKSGVERIKTRR